MVRRLSPERQRELDELRDIFTVFAAYLDERAGVPGHSRADLVARVYERRDLTAMRSLRNELVETLVAFSAAQRRELDERLREGPGTTLDALEAKHLDRIAKLRAKGRIATEPQYYVLKERVEVIWDDPQRREEFEALRAMLTAYEERVARRAAADKPRE
jgi:hypothetical protein